MRSWYPIAVSELDDTGLRGEHTELLILARTIAGIKQGWANHPETNRWRGHSVIMKARHEAIAAEMIRRGMNHKSPWPDEFVRIEEQSPPELIEPLESMWGKLRDKIHQRKLMS